MPQRAASSAAEEEEDCILWDESRNGDLRQVASPLGTPTSANGQTPRRTSSSSRAHVSSRPPSSSEVKRKHQASAHEVELIWSRLQTKAESPDEAEAATPLRGNPPPALSHTTEDPAHPWGLVKSRRKRRRPPLTVPVHTTTTIPPAPQLGKARRMSADDAFADLLQQLQTPERAMPPPNRGRQSLSSLANLQDTREFSMAPCSKETTHTTPPVVATLATAAHSSPDPFGPFLDFDVDALIREHSVAQAQQQHQGAAPRSLPPPPFSAPNRRAPSPHLVAEDPTVSTAQPNRNAPLPTHTPAIPTPVAQPSNPYATTRMNTSRIASVPGDAKQVNGRPHELLPMLTHSASTSSMPATVPNQCRSFHHIQPAAQRTVPAAPQPSKEHTVDVEEEDPFAQFSVADLAQIDLEIQAATRVAKAVLPADDPFGDFPEIDLAALSALDHQIEQHQTKSLAAAMNVSRYRIVHVSADTGAYSKTLQVARWKDEMLAEEDARTVLHRGEKGGGDYPKMRTWKVDGMVHLRGEWFYTEVQEGDFVHLVSLSGKVNSSRLPATLDTGADPTKDDMVLIVHPEMLLTPTTISETTTCTRRAVLKNRLGSTGLPTRALLLGTLRHQLFEETLKTSDLTPKAVAKRIDSIVRRSAEDLVGSGMASHEAKRELFQMFPQIKSFIDRYTLVGPMQGRELVQLDDSHGRKSTFFKANKVDSIEETIVSPELGLKGNIDVVVRASMSETATSTPSNSLVGIELKTGHNQKPQPSHMAQLVLYTLMLQARYGLAEQTTDEQSMHANRAAVLLYLNSESLKAIHLAPSIPELKTLLGQRNIVAIEQKKLTEMRDVVLHFNKDDEWPEVKLQKPTPARLSPIVESENTCERCYANRACTMYASLEGKSSGAGNPGASRVHKSLLDRYTGHLSDLDFDYFATWDRLIDFEETATVRSVATKWLRSSDDQETATGKTISSLEIKNTEARHAVSGDTSQMTLVTFQRSRSAMKHTPLSSLGFQMGCYAIISVDECTTDTANHSLRARVYLARGVVQKSFAEEIVLRVSESDLSRVWRTVADMKDTKTPMFRLDRDDVATGLGTLRRNLVDLFTGEKSPELAESAIPRRISNLREFVAHRRSPAFTVSHRDALFNPPETATVPNVPGLDMMDLGLEFSSMNPDQRHAIDTAMRAKDYTLIQGLPGTGKTSTISFLVRLLVAHGKRVLVTSYTHAAVDNVIMKLMKTGLDKKQDDGSRAVIRIGNPSSCHPKVKHLLAPSVASEIEGDSGDTNAKAETIRRCIRRAQIIGVTALSIPRSSLLIGEQFDVVIVDEAGQINQPAVLGALMAADTFVLVGDHMQLPPLVSSALAEEGGFGTSMLKRLAEAHPDHVAQLTYQYRMAEDICQLSNDIVYGGKLKCATAQVANRRLELQGFPENATPGIFTHAVDPTNTVVFLDTDTRLENKREEIQYFESINDRRAGGSLVNETEAAIVEQVIQSLLACGVPATSIGIVCPFTAQIRLLESSSRVAEWKQQGLECSTIDKFQGRDKPVIILSFVRSNAKGKVGRLLSDSRRLNVAVSRAESKLIMVGSLTTLYTGSVVLRPALDRLKAAQRVFQTTA